LYERQNRKCAISGLPIVFGKHNTETTASLDRIDSAIGYEKDNIQWVHKDVNIMKNIFPLEYFLGMCKKITDKYPNIKFDELSKGECKYGVFNQIC